MALQDEQPPYVCTDIALSIFTATAMRRNPNGQWAYSYSPEPRVHTMRPQATIILEALAAIPKGSLPAEILLAPASAVRLLAEEDENTGLFTPTHLRAAKFTENMLTTNTEIDGYQLELTVPADPVRHRSEQASIIVLDPHGTILSKR